jgi:outer membrane lipoprotein-sorting protein
MKTPNMRPCLWSLPLAPLALFAVIVAAAFGAVGCSPVTTTVKVRPEEIRPAKEATKLDLISAYNQLSRSITSINASVELVPTTGSAYSGVIQQYHEVNAFILAAKPAMIRVIGQAPVLAKNVFDMTSDGQNFHIYIPSKNKFIVGPAALERSVEKPIENLRPQHILDAIFWPEIPTNPPGTGVLFEEANESSGRYYVLTVLSFASQEETERKIWFDRADLSLCRVQIYGAGGRLLSDVHMNSWQTVSPPGTAPGGAAQPMYPRHIVLNRPHDDYQLDIRVKKITLNEEISLDRFKLDQPSGTELVRLGDTGPGSYPLDQK